MHASAQRIPAACTSSFRQMHTHNHRRAHARVSLPGQPSMSPRTRDPQTGLSVPRRQPNGPMPAAPNQHEALLRQAAPWQHLRGMATCMSMRMSGLHLRTGVCGAAGRYGGAVAECDLHIAGAVTTDQLRPAACHSKKQPRPQPAWGQEMGLPPAWGWLLRSQLASAWPHAPQRELKSSSDAPNEVRHWASRATTSGRGHEL